jgi:hypothetical protein
LFEHDLFRKPVSTFRDHALRRLARDYGLRRRPLGNRWRRKDRQIGVAAREPIETDLTISDCGKLTL